MSLPVRGPARRARPLRVLLVNPPASPPVQRRWVGEHPRPLGLAPPVELMSLGAIARGQGAVVQLLDAVAEGTDLDAVRGRAAAFEPDVVVGTPGFAAFEAEVRDLGLIAGAAHEPRTPRESWPTLLLTSFLATRQPSAAVAAAVADPLATGSVAVLLDEPEGTFAEALARLHDGRPLAGVAGLAARSTPGGDAAGGEGDVVVGPERPPLADLDRLPEPDWGLADLGRYREPLLASPAAVVLSARGRDGGAGGGTDGTGTGLLGVPWYRGPRRAHSVEWTMRHVASLVGRGGACHVRFLDESFPADGERLGAFCEAWSALASQARGRGGPAPTWSCHARGHELDPGRARRMAAAGCARVYVHLASGSPTVLADLGDEHGLDAVRAGLDALRGAGVESHLVLEAGRRGEMPDQRGESVTFALGAGPDFLHVAGGGVVGREERERILGRFYLRPSWAVRHLGLLRRPARDVLAGAAALPWYRR